MVVSSGREGSAREAEMEHDDDDAWEAEVDGDDEGDEDDNSEEQEMDGEGEDEEEEEEDDNVFDFHPLLLVQPRSNNVGDLDPLLRLHPRALSSDPESVESSTQVCKTEKEDGDGGGDEKGLANDDEEGQEEEEDGYLETGEDVQQMFSGSAEEFIGELDGDDKFFELATDYEEDELEDIEQEEKDQEYIAGCFNETDYDGDNCCAEEKGINFQQNFVGMEGKACSVAAGNIACGTKGNLDENYEVNEGYIAPDVLQQPRELAAEVVRSDESEGERDEDVLDPICKRTRARYSLADMSLDQLETFLQGSDEDEDFQAVDDREEYEKFWRAVLEDPPESEKPEQSSRKEEDDDEDEDVDFEIEIEELLDSDDASDSVRRRKRKRPETREKRRQRAQFQCRGPLRHLLPHVGFFANGAVNTASPLNVNGGLSVSGFTAPQIGQLYSLIHEHVQLLVQQYALTVWDPARQEIAANARKLLLELAEKRESVLSWKISLFPDFCFRPPYTHPSAIEGVKRQPLYCWPPDGQSRPAARSTIQTKPVKIWAPVTPGPVRSLLDVAPLALVPDFLKDTSKVMQARFEEFRQPYVETGASKFERLPLFVTALDEQDQSIGRNIVQGSGSRLSGNVELSPPCLPLPQIKQTMAAALVESTEKQGLAPVPKDVAAAVKRFFPYFNKALFPHKSPPLSSSSRIVFTDSEDELLAMGMMEFNQNWSRIRDRFLPPKTDHQIRIRVKNKCASKAIPNSIKAVHMMKTSPITDIEKKAIQDGLNYYKQDWWKVWANCVPHRNPNILPRQWRIASGTQKSYKTSESSKERRRLYEASRRRKIAAQKARNAQTFTDESTIGSTAVVASGTTTVSAERQRKKRKPKAQADNHSPGPPLQWLDPHAVKLICNDRTQAVKLAPHLSPVIMPPHVQVLSQSQVQQHPQQPSQQFRTFLAVGSTSNPCTKNSNSSRRKTARTRVRKDNKHRHQDPIVEERSQDPLVEQHIVMEKEELSDSEDEVDAGVEFEHEEMGDSDREK